MPFVLVIVGAVLLLAAWNNTIADLGSALKTDVPSYLKWALAITALGAVGFIPGMRSVGRWLVALVLVCIVLANYKSFASLASNVASGNFLPTSASGTPATTPAAAYIANPSNPQITQAEVVGSSSGTTTANVNATAASHVTNPFGAYDPAAFLTAFESGVGGFGGVA